ncbi:MAG TPA: hypothetical protein VMJ10_27515 [Kofleriaceae bacterium]|nr:hypothetical protein [Kofleriaceae bacterium]
MQRLLILCLIGASTAASAAPAPRVTARLHFDAVHAGCQGFVPAAAAGNASAKISLASCEAHERTRTVTLVDQERSVRELMAAVVPCLELLRDVQARAGLASQVAALDADANIWIGIAVRALGTVKALPASASPELIAQHDLRVLALRERVDHWFDRAAADFVEIARMVRRHPELARDPSIAAAVADAARHVVPTVASR